MTDLTTPSTAGTAAQENVGRGVLFSVGAILAAIVGYAILAGVIGANGYLAGVVAFVIPLFGAWLYQIGAGTAPKAGRVPWVVVMIVAIIVGALTVVVASAWYAYTRVGGDGGLFAPAFWRTVANGATDGEVIVPIIITLVVGGIGIVSALRGRKNAGTAVAPAAGPYGTTGGGAPAQVAPPAPGTPMPPVAPPAAPAQPSPGVVLNGEPVDPDKKA